MNYDYYFRCTQARGLISPVRTYLFYVLIRSELRVEPDRQGLCNGAIGGSGSTDTDGDPLTYRCSLLKYSLWKRGAVTSSTGSRPLPGKGDCRSPDLPIL